jgi:HEAT repeat protein
MTLAAAFAWLLGGLTTLCVLVAVCTGGWRLLRRHRERRTARALDPLRPIAYQLVTGDQTEVAEALRRLESVDGAGWPPLQDLLVGLFARVSGEGLAPVRRLLADRDVLQDARRDLTARSAVRRGRAAHLLGLVGDTSALTDIERLVGDRDPEIRVVACRALGRLGDARAARTMLTALTGPRPVPAGVVADALLGLGPEVQDALREALALPDADPRGVAADVAGLRGLVALGPALREILVADGDPDVRARAATALGRLGAPAALPDLVRATLSDQPPGVRRAAAEALGALGEPAATEHLRVLLDSPALLADTAARALVRLGSPGLAALETAVRPDEPSAAAGALAVASLRGPAWSR